RRAASLGERLGEVGADDPVADLEARYAGPHCDHLTRTVGERHLVTGPRLPTPATQRIPVATVQRRRVDPHLDLARPGLRHRDGYHLEAASLAIRSRYVLPLADRAVLARGSGREGHQDDADYDEPCADPLCSGPHGWLLEEGRGRAIRSSKGEGPPVEALPWEASAPEASVVMPKFPWHSRLAASPAPALPGAWINAAGPAAERLGAGAPRGRSVLTGLRLPTLGSHPPPSNERDRPRTLGSGSTVGSYPTAAPRRNGRRDENLQILVGAVGREVGDLRLHVEERRSLPSRHLLVAEDHPQLVDRAAVGEGTIEQNTAPVQDLPRGDVLVRADEPRQLDVAVPIADLLQGALPLSEHPLASRGRYALTEEGITGIGGAGHRPLIVEGGAKPVRGGRHVEVAAEEVEVAGARVLAPGGPERGGIAVRRFDGRLRGHDGRVAPGDGNRGKSFDELLRALYPPALQSAGAEQLPEE